MSRASRSSQDIICKYFPVLVCKYFPVFQLLLHVDPCALPPELGGTLDYDHLKWLVKCNQVAESQVT